MTVAAPTGLGLATALALVAVFAPACASSEISPMPEDGARTPSRAFEFALELSYEPQVLGDVPDIAFPTRVRVSGLLDETGDQPRLTIGGHWVTATVALVRNRDGRLLFDETDAARLDGQRSALAIGLPVTPSCKSVGRINVTSLTLDRVPGGWSGTAVGFATFSDGDALGARRFVAVLQTTPDRTGPVAPPPQRDVNPFDRVDVVFAEALAVTRAELRGAGDAVTLTNVPLEFPSACTTEGRLLPFGRTLVFTPAPALVDLGGNRASANALTVSTMAEPPLFAPDGFEGTTSATLQGDTALVTATEVPGVGAGRALFIGPGVWVDELGEYSGGRLVARIAIPAPRSPAARLRGRVAFLSPGESSLSAIDIRVAAPGGDIVAMHGPTASSETTPTGLAKFPRASSFTALEAPLPAGASDFVYVDIHNRARGCGGLGPPGALVIDDLRIE